MANLLDYVGLGHFLEKIKTLFVTGLGTSGNNLTWTKNGETNNITIPYATEASKLSILLTKTYENVLRNGTGYSSPYTNSYLYFGSVKTTNQAMPSHVKYRVLAYAPSNASFLLDSIVEWYFGNSGIYKGYYVWNNLSSTSYYPFYCHTLFSAKTAAIATSDGSYLGCYYGTSTSYGLSPSTVARTIKIDILECNNCTVSLLDNVVWLNNVDYVPANLKQPSTSKAYNDTNFTATNVVTSVGLQETGDANSDTVGYSIRTNSYSKPMKAALGYGYRLLFTSADLLGWVPANTSTSSNATAARTPCTEPIDPFGEIVYYAGTAAVAVNSRPGATSLWQLYTITFGYSFNTTGAALTLTSWKPVYIKCTPQANGSAVIEGYTQDLPNTEDGYIYIYLGVAYAATTIELVFNHPVYYYKNGSVRLWNNIPVDSLVSTTSTNLVQNSAVLKYIVSRGENLLTNGTCLLANNYNFSYFVYDGSDTYYAGGCFKKDNWGSYASFTNDEFIPVDVNQKYRFDFYTKTDTEGAQINGMIDAYDIDKKMIGSYEVAPKANTLTYLTLTLNPGDTVIYVNSLLGWTVADINAATACILFWGYKNSFGYEYPEETYTRYRYTNLWTSASLLDFTNNTITLSSPWNGPQFLVNTKLSLGQNGSGALYCNIDDISITCTLRNIGLWEHHFYHINGLLNKNNFPASQFPFGTAYIKVGLMNRSTGNGQNFKISTLTLTSLAVDEYLSLKGGTVTGNITATKFIKSGGTSSQFLKANGSVDSTSYAPTASPALTGTPTAPTAAASTNSTQIATTAFVKTAISGKQDTISDLATIRSGASAGATAYQKPSGGIPKSDLSSAVQTSLGKADTALQSHQDISGKVDKVTSTDNAVVRFNGTSGAVQNSGVTINDSNHVTAAKFITSGATSLQFVKGDGSLDSTSYGTYSKPSGGIPKTDLASAVLTSLGKADTALQSFTETDPTVPSWAKASTKPTYTASEVGALPSTTAIPSKTSDLTNDSGFVTTSDISGVYKYKGTKTNYSNLPTSGNVTGDVWNVTNANGNIPAGTNYAWNGSAWDALGGSVDLSGYVPTSRTINGKPLSANVTLSASDVSALPSSTTIPTALADLTADSTHRLVTDTEKSTWNGKYAKPSGGIPKTDLASAVLTSLGKADTALQSESDPVFSASAAAGITSSDITNWNGKTSNTGTITSVVTTAGAHTTINKTSGSATFNVPTKTSHLTNDSGFLTAHLSIKTVNGNTLVGTGNVTIPTPNDATLTIKRDGTALGTFTADSSQNKDIELRVLLSKTFTGVIGTANDLPGATFYFMSVLPLDRVKPCTVKYRIYASMEGLAEGIEESIVTMTFSKNTVLSYDVWNYIANGSYRPYYYHYRYLSTLAGHNSGYGHLVGVGMRYSYNPATAANARTYVIDILDIRGGTVTFFDTMLKFANVPGTGATNYSGETTYDATTNGETHLGDRNDVNYQNREYYGCRKTNSALYRYMLCLTKSDSSLVPLNSVNNSIATNKTLTTDSFDPFGEILFWNTTTTYAAGANVGDGWYRLYLCDIRYSFNCGGYNTTSTLVGRLPLYLVAVPQSDGTAVLHSEPLSLTLPNTENGLIYIYLGTIYPDNYPYRLNLALVHPIYYYKDLAVRLWTGRSYVSLETDPVFSASAAANITSSNITDWNNKESTSNKVTSISASSTDTLYPSAKCVYETILNSLQRDYVFIEGEDIYADLHQ